MGAAQADELMTLTAAGHRLNRSPQVIRQWIDAGRLTGVRTPLGRMAVAADVERLVAERAAREQAQAR